MKVLLSVLQRGGTRGQDWRMLVDAQDRWNLGYGLCREQQCQPLTWSCAAAL